MCDSDNIIELNHSSDTNKQSENEKLNMLREIMYTVSREYGENSIHYEMINDFVICQKERAISESINLPSN